MAELNPQQQEAVSAPLDPVLVLAGAGSGKTRVLIHRIAWLMLEKGASPYSVLAVTFTNKAAAEMRARIEHILGMPSTRLWVGTFHGIAHRLLRTHWQDVGLPQAFQIMDSDDQLRFIKRLLKNLGYEDSNWDPKEVRSYINHQKNEVRRPTGTLQSEDPARRQLNEFYRVYQETCDRAGVVDFAELLLRAYELWSDNPEILAHYQQRFKYLLVDEFQDTNTIQYRWMRLLAGQQGIPFVVGDDDQSIYRWRGARIEHIYRFEKDFPRTRIVRLEQNYRSTGTILAAANALIANNQSRMGKNLWTDGKSGAPIRVYSAYNERDEAEFVTSRIRDWEAQGGVRSEVAILYRSNAQSRVFEEYLINARIPYRVYGGLRFFERAEIKDALAYLRLALHRDDDTALDRIINVPTRGIGAKSVDRIREHAKAHSMSLWRAAAELSKNGFAARTANAVRAFLELIRSMGSAIEGLELHEQVDHVIYNSTLLAHYEKDVTEKGEARVENLHELVNAARGFDPGEMEEDLPPLVAFLAHASLESGEGQGAVWEDCVQMMTMHSAKGLEFPLVFMVGMEDGLFPHQRSLQDASGLEEERRLCYVGATRAMQQLYMTHAEQRRLHGTDSYSQPSRFIGEIPDELLEEIRPQIHVSRPVYRPGQGSAGKRAKAAGFGATQQAGYRLGQRVQHGKFGEGVILNFAGQGAQARVQVNFESVGMKELVLAYANLEVL
ncbi:MAG: DNA helicase II [Gammaproteobacteria bacterium]|nr:DNA helicase II [Gammaproteobacteria bacterium]